MDRLLLIDTTRVQEYIFNSNRLRENIGASYLAAQATGPWILECLEDVVGGHNVIDAAAEKLDPDRRYEDGLDAEVIYSGGGNAMIVFREGDEMGAFIRHYSRCLLLNAPGLQVYTADLEFDWEKTDRQKKLHKEVSHLFDEVAARAKRERLPGNPLLGVAVSAACSSTGLPAVAMAPMIQDDPDSVYPVSAEIEAKLKAVKPQDNQKSAGLADEFLHRRLGLDLKSRYLYPSDFDDLGRSSGEQSYLAVVHADGDSIGRHIQDIGADPPLDNRGYINARRQFSDDLKRVGRAAFLATVEPLMNRLEGDSRKGDVLLHLNAFGDELGRITLAANKNESRYYMPFRPLVMAGDDLTFVCDGRLGLALTTNYLAHFRRLFEDKFTASAGVAIVKVHYPFAAAYQLADKLAKSAKDYRRKSPGLQGGCLDWYFTAGGLHGDLEEMRRREYRVSEGRLTLRPVALEAQSGVTIMRRTWPVVRAGIDAFQDMKRNGHQEPQWSNRRSKVKALRDALRGGGKITKQFMVAARIEELPAVIEKRNPFHDDGWSQGYCGYFDALELADLFIPLP